MKVLVVENDQVLSVLWKETLEVCGHTVLVVTNSVAALSLLRAESVDAVLTDNDMETPDAGVYLIADIKRDAPHTVVVGMSGNGSAQGPMISAGAAAFLKKPFTISELKRALTNNVA